jgi:hypothetical protein
MVEYIEVAKILGFNSTESIAKCFFVIHSDANLLIFN